MQLILSYLGISPHQAHALNQFPETIFTLPTITSATRQFASVYEIRVTGKINMSHEQEGPLSDDKKSPEELKDNIFSHIPKFQKTVLNCELNQCPQKETLNFNMNLWQSTSNFESLNKLR